MRTFFLNQIFQIVAKDKFLQDSFWAIFGNASGKGLSLISGIFVAWFLGSMDFGAYSLLKSTMLSAAVFSTLGLNYTATKFISSHEFDQERTIAISNFLLIVTLVFSILFTIVILMFSDNLSKYFFKNYEYSHLISLSSIWISLFSYSTTQAGLLAGFKEFKKLAYINFWTGLLTIISTVTLTYYFDLTGAILGMLLTQAFNCYLNWSALLKKGIRFSFMFPQDKSEIIKFSIPLALQEITYSFSAGIVSILIIKYADFFELGIYSAAMQWSGIILFIPGVLRNVILSHWSNNNDLTNNKSEVLLQTISLNLIITIIPTIIVFLFASHIEGYYGNSYTGIGAVLGISVFATIFASLSNVFTQVLLSNGQSLTTLIVRIFRDSTMVLGCFLVVKYFTHYGVAYSYSWVMVITHLFSALSLFLVLKYRGQIQFTGNKNDIKN